MTSGALAASWERDDLPRMPLGERLVYMELRYLSDRKGTLRLSQSDLANKLGVTRQAIVKHVDALMAKKLVRRQGHGRYAVFAEPWSLDGEVVALLDSRKPGDEINPDPICRAIYGRGWDEMFADEPCADSGCDKAYADHLSEIWDAIQKFDGTRVKEDRDGVTKLIR